MFTLCRIMSCLERELLLHALPLTKHVTPNMYKLDQQWQCLPRIQKSSLVMTISICLRVWWGKRWEIFFYVNSIFQHNICNNILKRIMGCSVFIHMGNIANGYPNHWWYDHTKRCVTIGCGIPKWIRIVVKKWVEDKRNEGVLGQSNNQAPTAGPTQERKRVHVTPKGKFARRGSCSWSIKKDCIWK
jgi:hypothetical protein